MFDIGRLTRSHAVAWNLISQGRELHKQCRDLITNAITARQRKQSYCSIKLHYNPFSNVSFIYIGNYTILSLKVTTFRMCYCISLESRRLTANWCNYYNAEITCGQYVYARKILAGIFAENLYFFDFSLFWMETDARKFKVIVMGSWISIAFHQSIIRETKSIHNSLMSLLGKGF